MDDSAQKALDLLDQLRIRFWVSGNWGIELDTVKGAILTIQRLSDENERLRAKIGET